MRVAAALALLLLSACDSAAPGVGARYVGRADGRVDRYDAGETAVLTASDGPVTGLDAEGGRVVALVDGAEGRLVVVDANGLRSVAVASPRALAVAAGVAYVASRDATALVPVYLAQGQAGTPLALMRAPEGVAVVGQRVFVPHTGSNVAPLVSLVSTESLTVIAFNYDACTAPRTLFVDAEDEVWTVCTGRAGADGTVEAPGAVVVLDGGSGATVATFAADGLLGTGGLGTDGAASRAAGEAFVVQGRGLLRFDTRTNTLSARIDLDDAPVTAVAFDDAADRLLLGRQDSTGASTGFVSVHDRTGAETGRFGAGAVPTALAVARSDR